jgi:hypothetical protein
MTGMPAEAVTELPGQAKGASATEPATARALWPTFLRRTLAEDSLRAESPAMQRRHPQPAA